MRHLAICLVALLAAWAVPVLIIVVAWHRFWRRQDSKLAAETGHAADDQPVPYWPADPIDGLATAITCTWCRPVRHGLCSCTGLCGDRRCIRGGAWRLTRADREILEGKRLP